MSRQLDVCVEAEILHDDRNKEIHQHVRRDDMHRPEEEDGGLRGVVHVIHHDLRPAIVGHMLDNGNHCRPKSFEVASGVLRRKVRVPSSLNVVIGDPLTVRVCSLLAARLLIDIRADSSRAPPVT